MTLFIIILRCIGIAAILVLIVLLATESTKSALYPISGWTSIAAFGLSFLLQMIRSLIPSRKD